jgi:hypothetical protein
MKQLTRITLILLAMMMFATVSYGQGNSDNHFGLSDSCWQVFLSQLSGSDSSLGDYYDSLGTLDAQIDSMMKLIPGLRGKAVQTLQKQIIALRKQRNELRKQTHKILAMNMALLIDVQEHCGQDTTVTDTTDTTGGGGGIDSLTIGLNPNPLILGGSVNLSFTLAAPANVTVNVYSQTTATLVQSFSYPGLPAGPQNLLLNLGALPSGSYLIEVQTGTSVGTATLMIL